MHDVGKIGIPDQILLKPGKLTEHEFELMKDHARIGYELLKDSASEVLQAGAEIIGKHHEKYDGSGYPNHLAGEAIPLTARIFAIADVFDALTSVRPYKKAWAPEDAMAHIAAQAGQHFDPELVRLFAPLLPELLDIRQRWQD